MQLTDICCYLLCTITIVTAHPRTEHETQDISPRTDKRVAKREAAIFIDNFPIETIYKHRPKIIYRRISKQRYKVPKPKYGPPNKYRSSKPWKPSKKYPRIVKPKYGPPTYKRRPTKPKYGPPKSSSYKPKYGPPKKSPLSSFYPPEPIGFGEPPEDVDFQILKQSFGEPPLDSYGDPVSTAAREPYVPEEYSSPIISESLPNFESLNHNFGQDFNTWESFQGDQSFDNSVGYSRKRPTFIKPEQVYDLDEDYDSSAYSQIYKHREFYTEQEPLPFEKKKKKQSEAKRIATKSRKSSKPNAEPENEVLVGGRYAEPPERYVPKLPINRAISYSAFSDDEDFTPLSGYIDPDIAISATISPYVNYKNSNMAFSPQNLNDAFSIVEK